MSVVTYTFIVFLLCTIVLYYIVPKKIQWVILLLASLVFYGYAGIEYLFLVIATAVVVYLFSLRLQKSLDEQEELAKDADRRTARKIKAAEKAKRKKFLVWALVIVIGVLAVFKAFGFVLDNIKRFIPYDGLQSIPDWNLIAPLGISFYSFMMISYLVDLYNGRISAQKNFFRYLSYVLYFPHVTQGPIARYEEVGYQLWEEHSFNMDTIMRGVWLMLWGFVKKIVIADRIGAFTKEIFGHTFDYHGGIFLAVGIAYSIQIYCDFSGCMDIVRGTSECFGIVLGENFRRPYFSQTLPEFWRRWHITLGTWMKDYIFYPFSLSKSMAKFGKWSKKKFGNNVGKLLPVGLADILVFFVVGVWHGAAWKYIMYGIYNGVIVAGSGMLAPVYAKIQEKLHINPKKWWYQGFCIIRTFILVNIGFYFDMANDLRAANAMLVQTVTKAHISQLSMAAVKAVGLTSQDLLIVIAGCIIIFVVSLLKEKGINIRETIASYNIVIRWIIYIGFIMFILIYGSTSTTSDFIYANF